MTEAEVLKWAKDNDCLLNLYSGVKYIGKIDGNDVYDFIEKGDKAFCVGYPSVILVRDGEPEFVTGPTALDMLDKLDREN